MAFAGAIVAVSCCVPPAVIVAEVGDTETPVTATLPVVIDTLSNTAVDRTPSLCDVTARPTFTDDVIAIVSVPTCVHAVPFDETKLVNTFPARVNRTQYGVAPADPAVCKLSAPAVALRWKANPFEMVTAVSACLAFAAVPSLTITPAFAHGSVFVNELNLAVTVKSPLID